MPNEIKTAEILCVGTELLLGGIINTNAAYLSRELAALGVSVYHQTVVGDNPDRLKNAVSLALSRSDLVLITGGLGPTCDDLTRETVAELMGKKDMDAPAMEAEDDIDEFDDLPLLGADEE